MKSQEKGLLTDTLQENADSVNTPSSTFSMYTKSVKLLLFLPCIAHIFVTQSEVKSYAPFAQARFP